MSRLEKSLSTKKKLYLPSLFVISWPNSANNLYSYHLHISCSVCNCCAFTIIEKVRFLCLLWKKMMIPKIMRIWKVLLLKSRFSPNSQLDTFYKRSTLNILVWKLCHQSHSLFRKKNPSRFCHTFWHHRDKTASTLAPEISCLWKAEDLKRFS